MGAGEAAETVAEGVAAEGTVDRVEGIVAVETEEVDVVVVTVAGTVAGVVATVEGTGAAEETEAAAEDPRVVVVVAVVSSREVLRPSPSCASRPIRHQRRRLLAPRTW